MAASPDVIGHNDSEGVGMDACVKGGENVKVITQMTLWIPIRPRAKGAPRQV